MNNKPIVLMPEDVQRILGKDAQRSNILAAKMVSDIIKTTLGPKGMDKMLVSPTNEIIVTNDGVTILNEMQIENPAAKMMVEIAKTQDEEVGDGTTTAVMIAGKLLENSEKLLDQKIHPTLITKGYRLAAEKAQEILKELSIEIRPNNDEILKQIAITSMTGKGTEGVKEKFAEISVQAIKQINTSGNLDINNIKIVKSRGSGIKDSELIKGIILDKEKISTDMPIVVKNAQIALINFGLELKNPEMDTKISISNPNQLQEFISQEEKSIREMIFKIKNSQANVVLCQKGVDEFANYLLSKEGIYTCRRVSKSDMDKIAKATGGKILSSLEELNFDKLGKAGLVKERKQGSDILTYIEECENPKALTILIKGGTEHVMDEIERAIKDSLGVLISTLKTGLILPGGGAVEIELAKRLRYYGQSLSGREQLAVEEFASSLEFIPLTLAENAGLDPIEILTELKSLHDSGEINTGLNLFNNKIENVLNSKIIEPYKIKNQAITSATEVAIMILRIDDVIASSGKKIPPNAGGGFPYGGYD
jgi:archaeal chaperonin